MSDEILTDKQVASIAKFGRQQGGVTHDCISDLAESHEALRAEVERLEGACKRKDRILAAIGSAPDDSCPWIVVVHNPDDAVHREGGRASIVARMEVGKR